MEVNSLYALVYSLCKSTLANFADSFWIGHSAKLMEFSKEIVKVNFSPRIFNESRPVGSTRESSVLGFELVNNLWEIPWKRENISMLLLIKLCIYS